MYRIQIVYPVYTMELNWKQNNLRCLLLQNMKEAMLKDEHLAIGYHFKAILSYKLNKLVCRTYFVLHQMRKLWQSFDTQIFTCYGFFHRFEDAAKDFETAHKKLRGKNIIDYNQLGCRYKFYAFEVCIVPDMWTATQNSNCINNTQYCHLEGRFKITVMILLLPH